MPHSLPGQWLSAAYIVWHGGASLAFLAQTTLSITVVTRVRRFGLIRLADGLRTQNAAHVISADAAADYGPCLCFTRASLRGLRSLWRYSSSRGGRQ